VTWISNASRSRWFS